MGANTARPFVHIAGHVVNAKRALATGHLSCALALPRAIHGEGGARGGARDQRLVPGAIRQHIDSASRGVSRVAVGVGRAFLPLASEGPLALGAQALADPLAIETHTAPAEGRGTTITLPPMSHAIRSERIPRPPPRPPRPRSKGYERRHPAQALLCQDNWPRLLERTEEHGGLPARKPRPASRPPVSQNRRSWYSGSGSGRQGEYTTTS